MLRKAYRSSNPSLRSFSSAAFETVLMLVSRNSNRVWRGQVIISLQCYRTATGNKETRGQVITVQLGMVSTCSGKPTGAPTHLSEVSPVLPLKQFWYCSHWLWFFLILSMRIVECFLFLCLSPPGDQWCEVIGFMPADHVSSSSMLQISWESSHPCLSVTEQQQETQNERVNPLQPCLSISEQQQGMKGWILHCPVLVTE